MYLTEKEKTPDGFGLSRFFHLVVTGDDRNRGFFPAAGNYNGTSLNNRGSNGYYWSSSYNNSSNAYNLNFNSSNVNPQNNNNRYYGFSVRAVQHLSIFETA
jgi:uncharacterized protein (TIGR02145 family)